MSVIWHKVWFDLWQRKARTLLAILSIAAGVFAIGTIFGMVDQLLSTMDASHRATNPSHVNVILRQFIDKETADSLLRIEGVSGVEPLNIRQGRYKRTPDGEWESTTIIMREEYGAQQFDYLTLLEGAWPQDEQIAIERLSQNYFGLEQGEQIIFELEGTDRPFEIQGLIRHPFVPPPDFGGDTHFMVSAEVMARMGIPRGAYNQLLIQVEPYSEAYARDRMIAVQDQLAKQGVGIVFSVYQEPEEHWGRPFLVGITYVLQVLAVISLLTSVILVVNTMTSVITQQTDQIGVIKAIGGTSGVITRIYLAGVAVYGLLAGLVALPLGMAGAFASARYLLNVFNIDYAAFQFSQRAIAYQLLAALVAPLLAALWPVLQGAAISVREAIASYGIGGDFGSNRLDVWVEQIGERFLSSPYAIALGNMFRRKGRLFLTQAVLILAGAMFILVLTLSNSVTHTLELELQRRGYDIRLGLIGLQRADRVEDLARQVDNVVAAESWLTITGTVLQEGERIGDTAGLGSELFGVPAGSQMYAPFMTNGRWLSPTDADRVAVISQETAEFNNLQIGDIITIDMGELGDSDWAVIGTYQAIAPEPFATDPIYVPASALVATTKKANTATQIYITTQPDDAATTLEAKDAIRDLYETRNIRISMFISRTQDEERTFAYEQYSIMTNLLFSLAVVMGIVGGIGLMGALSISVVERTREIGVLRAIGARSSAIMGMFIMEGVLQGFLSFLIATPIAFVFARPMSRVLGDIILDTPLDFAFSYAAMGSWLLLVLTIAFLASLLPAYNATRISVRESLAYA